MDFEREQRDHTYLYGGITLIVAYEGRQDHVQSLMLCDMISLVRGTVCKLLSVILHAVDSSFETTAQDSLTSLVLGKLPRKLPALVRALVVSFRELVCVLPLWSLIYCNYARDPLTIAVVILSDVPNRQMVSG